jgi:hypothetical protein
MKQPFFHDSEMGKKFQLMPFQHSQNYKSPNTGVAGDRTNSLNQQLS